MVIDTALNVRADVAMTEACRVLCLRGPHDGFGDKVKYFWYLTYASCT